MVVTFLVPNRPTFGGIKFSALRHGEIKISGSVSDGNKVITKLGNQGQGLNPILPQKTFCCLHRVELINPLDFLIFCYLYRSRCRLVGIGWLLVCV